MSLLNAWVKPSEAVLAVDTEAVSEDGRFMQTSKLYPFAHLPAVFAARGAAVFHDCLAMQVYLSKVQSFDELVDRLPELIELAEGVASPHLGLFDARFVNRGQEIVFAGWSHRRARMQGWIFRKVDDMDLSAFDTVFHLANIANDPSVDLNPYSSWEVNVLAGMRLIDRAARQGVKQFIFASSASVSARSSRTRSDSRACNPARPASAAVATWSISSPNRVRRASRSARRYIPSRTRIASRSSSAAATDASTLATSGEPSVVASSARSRIVSACGNRSSSAAPIGPVA